MTLARIAGLALAASVAPAATAQLLNAEFTQPTNDRYFYPFGTDGLEPIARVFGVINIPGFDDRDAEMVLGFNTATQVPVGQPLTRYNIESVQVRVTVAVDNQFIYDPTFDSVRTSFFPSDPQFLADADAGKPVEIFPVGYRANWNALNWIETAPFASLPPNPPPAEANRNVFPIDFVGGTARDVSRQVRQRFESRSIGVGKIADVAAGALVPINSVMTFDLDLCDPQSRAYIQQALAQGSLVLSVSSLHPTGGQGQTRNYPEFYTKENLFGPPPFNRAAQLTVRVRLGAPADVNADSVVDINDFFEFLSFYASNDRRADFTSNCAVDVDDFFAFLSAYANG